MTNSKHLQKAALDFWERRGTLCHSSCFTRRSSASKKLELLFQAVPRHVVRYHHLCWRRHNFHHKLCCFYFQEPFLPLLTWEIPHRDMCQGLVEETVCFKLTLVNRYGFESLHKLTEAFIARLWEIIVVFIISVVAETAPITVKSNRAFVCVLYIVFWQQRRTAASMCIPALIQIKQKSNCCSLISGGQSS